jgi:hypothetical protein
MRRSAGLFLTFPPMRGVGVWAARRALCRAVS